MAPFDHVGEALTQRLDGNAPLMLDGTHAWLVRSGSVALFRLAGDTAASEPRRHLGHVAAGNAILWLPSSVPDAIAAVAMEPSELVALPFGAEAQRVAAGDADALGRFHTWVLLLEAESESMDRRSASLFSEPPTAQTFIDGLSHLQSAFLDDVARADARRHEDRRSRFHERRRRNSRIARETVETLATITRTGPTRDGSIPHEPPLLSAVRRVAEASGFGVRPAAVALASRRPLEAILEASGARSRRVLLAGRWWHRNGGPLLAFRGDALEPVALLPLRPGWLGRVRYRLVASDGSSAVVDDAVANTLNQTAHTLYAPLPDHASWRQLLRSTLRPHRGTLATVAITGVAAALLGMLTPQATNILLEHAIPDANRRMLAEIGLALLAAAAGALLFDLAQALSLLRVTTATAATLQAGVWDRMLDQSPAFFRDFTAGDLENRSGAVTQLRFLLGETTITSLLGSAFALLNLGLMFYYSASLAWMGLAIAVLAVAVCILAGRRMARIIEPLQALEGQLAGLVIQLIGAVPKLRIAGAETRAFAQWARVYTRRLRLKQQLEMVTDRVHIFHVILAPLATAGLYWWASDALFRGAAGAMTLGAFIAFSAAFGLFMAGATALGGSTATFLRARALWRRLDPILQGEPEVSVQKNSPGRLEGRIRLDHVTFRYRDDGPLTLNDVSLHAEPGECIALVGPSGSGKSTIINLLLRFETPRAGAVYIDDHDLNKLDVLAVRRQLGVVTQDNRILAGSIYDNIACGSLATLDDAWEAARSAGLEEDVRQMPMGMHTVVSEGGGNISGGQRQRVLIARALLNKPRVLILDEATSALDNHTQSVVTESLNRLKVTRILVAHRLSTIRQADRIYVIQSGRIVQHGTFDELSLQEGLFARLTQRQTA